MRQDKILGGLVTLNRYDMAGPDTLGTAAEWESKIRELVEKQKFKSLIQGWELNIWHMCHPSLVSATQTLRDYNKQQDGNQSADGLTWGDNKRMDIAIWPDGYSEGAVGQALPVPRSSVEHGFATLSHEFGHYYAANSQFFKNNSPISTVLTTAFRQNRPYQTSDEGEDFAECYRALLGLQATIGTYSDNKPAVISEVCQSAIRAGYFLSLRLRNIQFDNLGFYGHWVQWREYKPVLWWWEPTYFFGLADNFDLYRYELLPNNTWDWRFVANVKEAF